MGNAVRRRWWRGVLGNGVGFLAFGCHAGKKAGCVTDDGFCSYSGGYALPIEVLMSKVRVFLQLIMRPVPG